MQIYLCWKCWVFRAISFNDINWHSQQQVLSKRKIKTKNLKKTNCCHKCFKSHKILTCCQLSEPYKVMIYGKIPPERLYHNDRHNSIISANKVISAEHITAFNSKQFFLNQKVLLWWYHLDWVTDSIFNHWVPLNSVYT